MRRFWQAKTHTIRMRVSEQGVCIALSRSWGVLEAERKCTFLWRLFIPTRLTEARQVFVSNNLIEVRVYMCLYCWYASVCSKRFVVLCVQTLVLWYAFARSGLLYGNKIPTRCNRCFFIGDLIACSTCFGHHYAHHQEPKSIIQWLLPVVFGALVFKLSVWCRAVTNYQSTLHNVPEERIYLLEICKKNK